MKDKSEVRKKLKELKRIKKDTPWTLDKIHVGNKIKLLEWVLRD